MLQQHYVFNSFVTRGSTSQQQVILRNQHMALQEPCSSNIFQVQVCPRLSSSSVTSVPESMLQQHYVFNSFVTRGSTSQQQVILRNQHMALQEPCTSNIFPPSPVPNRFIFTNIYHGDRSNVYIDRAQNHTCYSLAQHAAASEQYASQSRGKKQQEKEHAKFNDTTPSTNEIASSKQRKKLGRKKKKVGAPERPMTANNFYFQHKRRQLLDVLPVQDDEVRNKKRQRKDRSPHHKISFSTLGKIIGTKWKQLDSEEKAVYDELATDRYLREKEVFEAKETQKATRDLVDSSEKKKQSESNSISSATTSKNQRVASANQLREQGHPAITAPSSIQHDLQNDSKQEEANASGSYIHSINAQQYSHLLYQQIGRSYTCDIASRFTKNVTNYEALQQNSFPSNFGPYHQRLSQSMIADVPNYEAPQQNSFPMNFEPRHQQPLYQSMMMMSSNQECQEEAALSTFADANDAEEDVIEEPKKLKMKTFALKSEDNMQEDSYYFVKE